MFAARYHHELRPISIITPPVPDWKGPPTPPGQDDDQDADSASMTNGNADNDTSDMQHSDQIGEAIAAEEQYYLQALVYDSIMQQVGRVRFGTARVCAGKQFRFGSGPSYICTCVHAPSAERLTLICTEDVA